MPDQKTEIIDLPVSKLDYELPKDLIAQKPLEKRDNSRLMVCHRSSGEIKHRHFHELPEILRSDILLVRNTSRVFPARVEGIKETGGKIELLFLRELSDGLWRIIFSRRARMPEGRRIFLFDGEIIAELVERITDGKDIVRVNQPDRFRELMTSHGKTPLPPYITNHEIDPDRYQTIYAEKSGSAAAPTAGLHFTDELISKLDRAGIRFVDVELQIGLDTFSPVRAKNLKNHTIHTEFGIVPEESAQQINRHKESGGKVLAVGTTSTRLIEFASERDGGVSEFAGNVNLFILPGYKFNVVDHLMTNFHLPRTTLLALVGAFMGLEFMFKAYNEAIKERYRFYSFGDSMLIL